MRRLAGASGDGVSLPWDGEDTAESLLGRRLGRWKGPRRAGGGVRERRRAAVERGAAVEGEGPKSVDDGAAWSAVL
jgi:hypothetical protein